MYRPDSSVAFAGETIKTLQPYEDCMESRDKTDERAESLSYFTNEGGAD